MVLAEDLARDRIISSELFLKNLLLPKGRSAEHAGQPVAILIFDSFRHFWTAGRLIHSEGVVRYGPPGGLPVRHDIYGTVHYVRAAGTPNDAFSRVKDGWHDPDAVGADVKEPQRSINLKAREVRDGLKQAIDGRRWRVFGGTFSTQIVDPMFMEPEAWLAWWHAKTRRLHLVVGPQSPDGPGARLPDARPSPLSLPAGVAPVHELLSGRRVRRARYFVAPPVSHARGGVCQWAREARLHPVRAIPVRNQAASLDIVA